MFIFCFPQGVKGDSDIWTHLNWWNNIRKHLIWKNIINVAFILDSIHWFIDFIEKHIDLVCLVDMKIDEVDICIDWYFGKTLFV